MPKDNVTDALATMANICQHMVEMKKFASDSTNLFCLRAMTGAIILYDHLHPVGAFHKKSPIAMRNCIQVLKSFTATAGPSSKSPPPSAGLLNALRFTTKHLNDVDTPSSIKQLLSS